MLDQSQKNPISKLRDKVNSFTEDLEKNQDYKKIIRGIQIPRSYAEDLMYMSASEWVTYSNGFITLDSSMKLIRYIIRDGVSAITGLRFGATSIWIANDVEDDCEAIELLV